MKTLIVAAALAAGFSTEALAQDFGAPLKVVRESSPRFGTGPDIAPEIGSPPAWEYAPTRTPIAVRTPKDVIAAPELSSPAQTLEVPLACPGAAGQPCAGGKLDPPGGGAPSAAGGVRLSGQGAR